MGSNGKFIVWSNGAYSLRKDRPTAGRCPRCGAQLAVVRARPVCVNNCSRHQR